MPKFAMLVVSAMGMPDGMEEVLKQHNIYRCMHGVQELKWDDAIASSAQKWATEGTCDKLEHSHGKYGENIYWAKPAPAPSDLHKGVDSWYEEIKFTDHGATSDWCGSKCGHYTQVVWAGSKSVGCGTCKGTMVCQYDPAGNMEGDFDKNVNKVQKSKEECMPKPPTPPTPPPTPPTPPPSPPTPPPSPPTPPPSPPTPPPSPPTPPPTPPTPPPTPPTPPPTPPTPPPTPPKPTPPPTPPTPPPTPAPSPVPPPTPPKVCHGAVPTVNFKCEAGTRCCGSGTLTPSCIDYTYNSCCEHKGVAVVCAKGQKCGVLAGVPFCQAIHEVAV